MKRLLLLGILFVVAVCAAAEVVLLTDTPVARFELPSGEVYTNAYAFKRTQEGMMVVHDGGSFWLNYRTLPVEWQEVYAGRILEENVPVFSRKVSAEEPHSADVRNRASALPASIRRYIEAEEYDGRFDERVLELLLLNCVLTGERNSGKALMEQMRREFPDNRFADPGGFMFLLQPCAACDATGKVGTPCKRCGGDGKCYYCGGDGRRNTEIGDQTVYCVKCYGTEFNIASGKCDECAGEGVICRSCRACGGRKKVLNREKCMERIAVRTKGFLGVLRNVYGDDVIEAANTVSGSMPGKSSSMRELQLKLGETGSTAKRKRTDAVDPEKVHWRWVPSQAIRLIFSDEYNGELDEQVLTLQLLGYFQRRNNGKVQLIKKELDERFPYSRYAGNGLLDLLVPCSECDEATPAGCKACTKGRCNRCKGRGTLSTFISGQRVTCLDCNGTGKCPVCRGVKNCMHCGGLGKAPDSDSIHRQMDVLRTELENHFPRKGKMKLDGLFK